MKYIVFSADYNLELCIRYEFSGMPATGSLILPTEIKTQISNWQQEYWRLMMMYTQDEEKYKSKFEKLDHQGIAIAAQIIKANKEHIEIKYYSERFLSYKMLN